ncbi:MAG: hypothetical protein ABIP89_00720 [Polyangiaceae bacterium]
MRTRKEWLETLASTSAEAWMTAVMPAAFDGVTRIESRRTVYRFDDGVCIEAERRSGETTGVEDCVGMRVVGWVIGTDTLVATWRPGARAVLWRLEEDGTASVALTSPTFAFVAAIRSVAPAARSLYWRRGLPSYAKPKEHSATLIGLPA